MGSTHFYRNCGKHEGDSPWPPWSPHTAWYTFTTPGPPTETVTIPSCWPAAAPTACASQRDESGHEFVESPGEPHYCRGCEGRFRCTRCCLVLDERGQRLVQEPKP